MPDMPNYKNCLLEIIPPDFNSRLMTSIINLEKLRDQRIGGEMLPVIFFQIKDIFHILESIGSARIEGNNTSVSEYIEHDEIQSTHEQEKYLEIKNVEEALNFTEAYLSEEGAVIDKQYILQMHRLVVAGLTREGDLTPGKFRKTPVRINKSDHIPPPALMVEIFMDELVAFINEEASPQEKLLKIAIAHHRFAWIHPFRNGNGRVVRLLTYAMLLKYGYQVSKAGRIINPTAIFCIDRERYYKKLSSADLYTKDGILEWCDFVITGIEYETKKIDKLLVLDYVRTALVLPALNHCKNRNVINHNEYSALKIFAQNMHKEVMSADLKPVVESSVARTRLINKLKEQNLIKALTDRKYTLQLARGPLVKGMIRALNEQGFLSGLEN